ncbi:MAG TPA: hypothetical protein DCS67_08570 [Clostridiales bacterium UBA8960]|jgi:membrane-associated protease RseP (regulator of RpoE activity)|nr:hypothetical protein [Clostridiales bacterium UBA8960]
MKVRKRTIGALLVLILVLIAGCTGQSNRLPKSEATIEGKVIGLRDGGFLLASETGGLIYASTNTPIYNMEGVLSDASALKNGQVVEIGFSGMIMESYPGQLGDPKYIKIVEQQDDMAGLYGRIISDILVADSGLRSNDEYVVMDLSQITNLSEVEKQALINLMSLNVGLIGVSGNLDDFMNYGYSENGIFTAFEIKETTDVSIKFDLYKMHKGEDAYYFRDALAKKANGNWAYTVTTQGK